MRKIWKRGISVLLIMAIVFCYMPQLTVRAADTWTSITSGATGNFGDIVYGNGYLLASTYDSGDIYKSTDDGKSWNKTATLSEYASYMAYGNDTFVVGSLNSEKIYYSTDGEHWYNAILPNLGNYNNINGIVYGGNGFIAAASSGSQGGDIFQSSDGIHWNLATSYSKDPLSNSGLALTNVCYGDGKYVVAGAGGSGRIFTSTDGTTWEVQNTPSSINYYMSVAYGNGHFIAGGQNGEIITSTDGTNWSVGTKPAGSVSINDMIYDGTNFYAVCSGGQVLSSPDGETWSLQPTGVTSDLYGIVNSDTTVIAVGDGGSIVRKTAVPIVTVQDVSSLNTTSATLNGTIVGLGDVAATDYGFCYSTAENPTTLDIKKSNGTPSATGTYTTNLTGLIPATTYYVRAYITNSDGTQYSAQKSFSTLAQDAPTITADTSNNDVDHDMDLTYIANADYQQAINKVTFNGAELTNGTDYVISGGKITLKPQAGNTVLQAPSVNSSVVIKATGYKDATVTQTIHAGAVTQLHVTTQPVVGTLSGSPFATQPVITLKDQYGNICADGVSASAVVVATAKAGSGTWTLGGTNTATADHGVASFGNLTCTTTQLGTGMVTFSTGIITKDSNSFSLKKMEGLANTLSPSIDVIGMLTDDYAYTETISNLIALNKSDASNVTYSIQSVDNSGNVISASSAPQITGSTLAFTLKKSIASSATDSIIHIKVSSDNYSDIIVDIPVRNNLTLTTPSLSGVLSVPSIPYGNKLSTSSLSGSFIDSSDHSTVAGTLTWDTPNTVLGVGSHNVSWTFTPTNQLKYGVTTGTTTINVTKREITIALDQSTYSKTYGDTDPAFSYHIVTGSLVSGESLTNPLTYVGTTANTYNIVVDDTKNANYSITLNNGTGAMKIEKRALNIASATIDSRTYDGTTTVNASQIHVNFGNVVLGDTILYNCDATALGNAEVGTGSVTVTVSLNAGTATNYTLPTNTCAANATVTKATLTSASFPSTMKIVKSKTGAFEYTLSDIELGDISLGKTTGARTYAIASSTGSINFATAPNIVDDKLKFELDGSNLSGSEERISVKMSSDNYADITAVLTIQITDKVDVTFGGIHVTDKTYNGLPIVPNGTLVVSDGSTPITIPSLVYNYTSTDGSGYNSSQAPKNVGDYQLTISVPTSNSDYAGSTSIAFRINKAPLQIKAIDRTIVVGDVMPSTYALSYSGFQNGESESTPGIFGTAPVADCSGNSDTVATYDIVLNTPVSANYDISTVKGKLTVGAKNIDETYYTVSPSANKNGWYSGDITITPTGKDGFSKIRIGTTGSFSNSGVINTESLGTSVAIYLEKGNAISNATMFNYKLDKTAPSVPIVNIVNTNSTAITGNAEAGSNIAVTTANGTLIGSTTVKADGTYSVTIAKQDKDIVLYVISTDAAGNESKANVTVKEAISYVAKLIDSLPDPQTASDTEISNAQKEILTTKAAYDDLNSSEKETISSDRKDKLDKLMVRLNATLTIHSKDTNTNVTADRIGTAVLIPELQDSNVGSVKISLNVTPVSPSTTPNSSVSKARVALQGSGQDLLAVYDISLLKSVYSVSGALSSNGRVSNSDIVDYITIRIPVPKGYENRADLVIIYIDDAGNVTKLKTKLVTIDGVKYLEFQTNHFSQYAIAQNTTASSDSTNPVTPTNPINTSVSVVPNTVATTSAAPTKTGDTSPISIFAGMLFISGTVIVITVVRRKRKNVV